MTHENQLDERIGEEYFNIFSEADTESYERVPMSRVKKAGIVVAGAVALGLILASGYKFLDDSMKGFETSVGATQAGAEIVFDAMEEASKYSTPEGILKEIISEN